MTDCYFHGNSGGGGICTRCEEEKERELEEGSLGGFPILPVNYPGLKARACESKPG